MNVEMMNMIAKVNTTRKRIRMRAVHLVKSTGTAKAKKSRSSRMIDWPASVSKIIVAPKLAATTANIIDKLSTYGSKGFN